MQKIKLTWPDGSKITYQENRDGSFRRTIDYFDGEHIENASKYYYLKILENYRDIGRQTYEDIKCICDLTTDKYSKSVETELCRLFSKPIYGEGTGSCVFMTVIYLAMIDLEAEKKRPEWLGKKLVLDSCKAVLIENVPYKKAATLHNKKNNAIETEEKDIEFDNKNDNEFDDDNYTPSYEKYGGYNGYDDDTIDYGFDGHPEATWNVD